MIGPMASTQVAIRAPSLGSVPSDCSMDRDAWALDCKYPMLFISDCRRYCSVCSFGVSIYREQVIQSFQ